MRSHPLWRGFWLAVLLTASLVLMGFTDCLAPFRLERPAVAYGGAVVTGAFLGSLPGRLRKNARAALRTTWQRCLRSFVCGVGLALSFALAGDERILPGLLSGAVTPWLFGAAALLTGFATIRITGRARP